MTAELATQLQDALGSEYRLERELMGGGMSRLFLATDVRLDRQVVVKVLRPELLAEDTSARFKREIELTVRLQHPHILPILKSGDWEQGQYYVTPFLPGESLRDRIAREGKLPLSDILRILSEVTGALIFAHQRSIVHRDVKPGNILLADGHAVLADFGIARAISTTATPLTRSGVVPGTPGYMAPELITDTTVDIFALGVVGCEMLIGRLPPRNATSRELVVARGETRGESGRRRRMLASVLSRAIADHPKRRWSAEEFAARLRDVERSAIGWRTAGVGAVLGAAALSAVLWARRPSERVDLPLGNPFLVLPLTPEAPRDTLAAVAATRRIWNALSEWREDTLIDERVARQQAGEDARKGSTLSEALAAARRVGASTLVWGTVGTNAATIRLRVTAYAVASGTPLRTREAESPIDDDSASVTAARRAINGLLRTGSELPWRDAADKRQASLVAWRSYDAGRAAITRWDLGTARRTLQAAIDREPELASGHLWLGQALYWLLDPQARETRRTAVKRAFSLRSRLHGRDTLLAAALNAQSDALFPEACRWYREMIRTDSSDFVGWLGLSDCQIRDAALVPDKASPSGWRFRASFADAERAIRRASYLVPPTMDPAIRGWLLARLKTVVDVTTARYGMPVGGGDPMYAHGYLDHDTLVFIPYAAAAIASGQANPRGAARDSALDHVKYLIQRSAEQWVTRAPADPKAWMELAEIAELTGEAMLDGRRVSGLDVVQRAQSLARDSVMRVSLSVMAVRMNLAQGDFARAASIADSSLRSGATHHPEVAGVAGLAALLGHVEQAAQLNAKGRLDEFSVELPDGRHTSAPVPVLEAQQRLMAYAALGGSIDTLRATTRDVDARITANLTDTAMRAAVRAGVLTRAFALQFPENTDPFIRTTLREFWTSPNLRIRAQLALAAGDTATARARVDSFRLQRQKTLVTSVPMDGAHRRAVLELALRDTAGAIAELDKVLLALPALGTHVLDEVSQVGALVRGMALRAELAKNAGDTVTAKHWASAVSTLWHDAAPPLNHVVERMQLLARD